MGGNALQYTLTRRYSANEYHPFANKISRLFQALVPDSKVSMVKAYHSKTSFGDLDILIEDKQHPIPIRSTIEQALPSLGVREMVKNGPVWSLGGFEQLQVDLIFQPPEDFDVAQHYFNWNDCGNLLGRIARLLGFKLGHRGLFYIVQDGSYKIAELCITQDWAAALRFLGYDPVVHETGFEHLEDMFEFVLSSRYFTPQPFLLENRDAKARTRDAKRASYCRFLNYIKSKRLAPATSKVNLQQQLQRAFKYFAAFELAHSDCLQRYQRHNAFKKRFNGALVHELTGLDGKHLGDFMQVLRQDAGTETELEIRVLNSSPMEIETWIRAVRTQARRRP